MKKINDEELALESKPTGKPTERIKGRLLKYKGTDYCEFVPEAKKAAPPREMLKQTRGVAFYKNRGEKEESYSLHVNVDGNTKDAASEILSKVQETLAPLTKKEPKLPTAKFVEDREELKVWFRKKEKQLCCHLVLNTDVDPTILSAQLFRLSQEVNKIIVSKTYKK